MTRHIGDIAAALAYQVKKEIAENYFGTRKELERERDELLRAGKELLQTEKETVLPLLEQICRLFMGEEERAAFLTLIGRSDLQERCREGSGPGHPFPGPASAWTLKGKYTRKILSLYLSASTEAASWETRFRTWRKKVALFNEDLAQFNANFSLSEILSLTASLDEGDQAKCVLGERCDPQTIPHLEEKLRLRPLDPSQEGLAAPPPLPPLRDIQRPLKALIHRAFRKYGREIKKTWSASSRPQRV